LILYFVPVCNDRPIAANVVYGNNEAKSVVATG